MQIAKQRTLASGNITTACELLCRPALLIAVACISSFGLLSTGHAEETEGVSFGHKLILEDPDGGSDSSVSPDGKWLAYSSRRSGNPDIWLAEIETGQTRQLTTHPATDNEPRWHPDGTKLVFVTQRNGSQDVYVIDLDSGRLTEVATKPVHEDYPSFSRDGSEICFTGGPQGSREVQIHNLKSGKTRTLTKGFGYIGATNFSPDGKRLVFHAYYDNSYRSGKSDLYVIPTSGGEAVNITNERATWDYKPNWSFDGEWITFSSKRASPNFNLWLIRPDGSDRQPLTNVKGPDLRWSNWTRDGRVGWHRIDRRHGRLRILEIATGKVRDVFQSDSRVRYLSPSPNGNSVVFESDGEIYAFSAEADAKAQSVVSGVAPRWNADGGSISFLKNRRSQIGIKNLGGGDIRTIDLKPEDWAPPRGNPWSPDGKQLVVATIEDGKHQLWRAAVDGRRRKLLLEGSEAMTSPVWSRDGSHIFFVENHPRSVGYYISTESVIPAEKQKKLEGKQAEQDGEEQVGEEPDGEKQGARTAVDFELCDLHGDRRTLSSLQGKVTLLYFWSTLRECEADLKVLQHLHNDYVKQGVSIVGLVSDSGTREDVARFLGATGVSFTTLMCSQDVCRKYRVATYPTTFLIDSESRIQYWMYGILERDHWEQRIRDLLANQSLD